MKTNDDAVLSVNEGSYEMRMERFYPYAIDRVWAALIEPEQRKQWLADGEAPLESNAEFVWRWQNGDYVMTSRVIRSEPPRLFEFYWWYESDESPIVRWELTPEDNGTRFVLTHTFSHTRDLHDTVAGWHTHLELFEALLNDTPAPWDWDRWNALKAHYAPLLTEHGIMVESPGDTVATEVELKADEPILR